MVKILATMMVIVRKGTCEICDGEERTMVILVGKKTVGGKMGMVKVIVRMMEEEVKEDENNDNVNKEDEKK